MPPAIRVKYQARQKQEGADPAKVEDADGEDMIQINREGRLPGPAEKKVKASSSIAHSFVQKIECCKKNGDARKDEPEKIDCEASPPIVPEYLIGQACSLRSALKSRPKRERKANKIHRDEKPDKPSVEAHFLSPLASRHRPRAAASRCGPARGRRILLPFRTCSAAGYRKRG